MTLLSVVLPAYRVQGYLRECLDSILDQGFDDVEVIAVDDRSPDHCGAILDEYAARDPRVTVLHLPDNVGLGEARNAGLDRATGEYVWFVDSDDALKPGSLAAVAARLRVDQPDVLIVDFERTWPIGKGRRSGMRRQLARSPGPDGVDITARPVLVKTIHTVWNKIVRRDLLVKLDLRFGTGWYEDVSWTYPLLAAAERICVLERVCYSYRQRRVGAITRTQDARHFELFDHWERAWQLVDGLGERADAVRPLIFERMVWHCMTVVGNDHRLPRRLRRRCFLRIADMFHRYLPPGGYAEPPGKDGLRYRLVARRAWAPYWLMRSVTRLGRRAAALGRSVRGAVPKVAGRLRRGPSGLLGRAYYEFQRLLPVDDRLALYAAYWYRGVACNPAAVYHEARRLAPHVRGVWLVRPETAGQVTEPHLVDGSRAAFRALARARWLVNNVNFPNYVRRRRGQVYLQTHHGTPVKTMGLDQQYFPAGADLDYAAMLRRCDAWDFSVSANPFSTQMWERSYPCRFEALETGYPRNDRLALAGAEQAAAARAALGIAADRIVVLYAPTFRPEPMALPVFDPQRVADALGPRGLVLVRGHYLTDDRFPAGEQVRDVFDHPVVEDLYLAADVLVSDYSSAIFDFAVLDRPIVLYTPDWAEYRRQRGVVLDVVAQPPGPVVRGFDELVALLRDGGQAGDAALRRAFRERFCAWEDGHAAERVVRRVFLGEPANTR
ncbi:bifunctional glycosyltransferase family 2 protein/CDP-glycerol:glycerophosphate glycerophosphotransferase [Catellatospora sp. NPDC049609]|uniref:bifunctional glycosyltransferase/CDP-glycerol:glycerophosphate glycerophosphotransferase n=1 Tax=Catellatospora sp. NPDC049609 TaxID=3155505 RepID=UPI00343F92A3